MKLGIVAFGNDSGLGNQTRRLVHMLKPFRIMLIDSRGFSKNKQYKKNWYDGFTGYTVDGFPNNKEINVFLKGLTHVLVCENPLNFFLFSRAKDLGIKSYCQSNYEFCDNLVRPDLPVPDVFVMPSYWHVDTMSDKFGEDSVRYLPPPTNPNEFNEARQENFRRSSRKLKLLHIVGTLAIHDRNGTLDLLNALDYTDGNFELVIRSQHPLPDEYIVDDHRITYAIENIEDPQDLYKDADALILPRRYGGLSLTTNEALMSGLPVLMPDISPNNQLLPKEWLYPATKKGEFFTRTMIDIYEVDPKKLAKKIDWLLGQDIDVLKTKAFDLGHSSFSDSVLRPKYEALFGGTL